MHMHVPHAITHALCQLSGDIWILMIFSKPWQVVKIDTIFIP